MLYSKKCCSCASSWTLWPLIWDTMLLNLWQARKENVILLKRYLPYLTGLLGYRLLGYCLYELVLGTTILFWRLSQYQWAGIFCLGGYHLYLLGCCMILDWWYTSDYLFSLGLSLGLSWRWLRVATHRAILLHFMDWVSRPDMAYISRMGITTWHDMHSRIG